jgi:mycobactin lysine-N-oxygenase
MPTLAVIGAGPKGIAIAAKARALETARFGAPRVVLIDPGAVAGNWSGRQGHLGRRGGGHRGGPADPRRHGAVGR